MEDILQQSNCNGLDQICRMGDLLIEAANCDAPTNSLKDTN